MMSCIRFLATISVTASMSVSAGSQELQSRPDLQHEAYIEKFTQTRDRVSKLAFDPDSFFLSERYGQNLITIVYTGDDMAAPVYSLAIREGCLRGQPTGRHCATKRTARMVRAPAPPGPTRPRSRSHALIQQVLGTGAVTREQLASTLDEARLEWVEADFTNCPAATDVIRRSNQIAWVPAEVYAPEPDKMVGLVMHADMVQVTFIKHLRRSIYHGYVADKSPGRWAEELAEALEPCWRPSTTTPP